VRNHGSGNSAESHLPLHTVKRQPSFLRDEANLLRRLQRECRNLRSRVDKCTIRVSKCSETYVESFSSHGEYDPFLAPCEPTNPWIADSTELWEMYDKGNARDQVSRRRRSILQ